MKPHLIVTASCHRFEKFLVRHWLRSLRANVDLTGVEVAVVDLGLSDECREQLLAEGVVVQVDRGEGHPAQTRYRGLQSLLREREYDQVLMADAGDLIFQANVRNLLDEDRDRWRAVCEPNATPLYELPWICPPEAYYAGPFRMMTDFLRGRPVINSGMILAPAEKFEQVWDTLGEFIRDFGPFGLDQPVLNYVLYRDGFVELPSQYNFVLLTSRERYRIERGVFYDDAGDVIPIVHNAGMVRVCRPIRCFGYGPERNKKKRIMPVVQALVEAALYVGRGKWLAARRPSPTNRESRTPRYS